MAEQRGERARHSRREMKPLVGGQLAITALALALGTFMQVLDSTIANVSLPTIAGNLGVTTDQGTWVITAFAVANGIGVPLTGWLMGRYGVVRTFVVSVLAFTVASLLCGIAWSLPSLIFFRVLQGGVSGPMIPGSQALLISIFPPRQARHRAGHLVHHHPGGADLRADPGRLYFRQLPLGLDLPDQCAGGPGRHRPGLDQPQEPRDARPASCRSIRWAWRCWWSGSGRCR